MSTPGDGFPGNDLQAWLRHLEVSHPRAIDMGLERCGAVYRKLGSPRPARRVATIAGTNGKGSTAAYLTTVLRALGHRCGTYTSPHLLTFNERLVINDQTVSDATLIEAFAEVDAARGEISLTYFEFTTLACLLIMARANLDFAVLEVGLGGRLDTVNLVDTDCAVIVPIGFDHMDFLGHDLQAIGLEKAGIMRPGSPVVLADSQPPESVIRHARALAVEMVRYQHDYCIEDTADGQRLTWRDNSMVLPEPPITGVHQPMNMAAAVVAATLLDPDCWRSVSRLRTGLRQARLRGRLEQLALQPPIWCDIGHNPMAAQAVTDSLLQMGSNRMHVVLGMYADKDCAGVARALEPCVKRWYCAGLPGPRGQSGEQLAGRLREALPQAQPEAFAQVAAALESARSHCGDDEAILIFGSFDTAARAITALSRIAP